MVKKFYKSSFIFMIMAAAIFFAASARAQGDEMITSGDGSVSFNEGEASITIEGNEGQSLVGKKFNVYRLFCAENSAGGESIDYKVNPDYENPLRNAVSKGLSKDGTNVPPDQVTEYMIIDYFQSMNSNAVEGAGAAQDNESTVSTYRIFIEDLRNELLQMNVTKSVVKVTNVKSNNSVVLNGLEYGYYLIDEVTDVKNSYSAGSLCMTNTANPTAEIQIKSDYPSIIKKILEDDECDDIKDPEKWNDIGDYEIGQRIPFKFVSNIPNINGYKKYFYGWHDIMDPALTFLPDTVNIEISGKNSQDQEKSYRLKNDEFTLDTSPGNGATFKASVDDIKEIVDREFGNFNGTGENEYGQEVIFTYNAVLNENAAKNEGRPGFENDVRLEFSNDPDSDNEGSTGFTVWDSVVCFTYRLEVLKTNDHGKELAEAGFRLYSDSECENEVYVKKENDGYIIINRDSTGGNDHSGGSVPENSVEMKSAADGTLVIHGLDGGVYYLKEVTAPVGYRLLKKPIVITVKPLYTDERDSYIKGEGATEQTLKNFEAKAHTESFYDGLIKNEDKSLDTDVTSGSVNLKVINKVGKKLPVTGTPAVLIMFIAGIVMMSGASFIKRRNSKKRRIYKGGR